MQFLIPNPKATNGYSSNRRTEYFTTSIFPTPRYSSRRLWHKAYHQEIFQLYQIYRQKMMEQFPSNNIDWDNINLYNDFSRLLYESSSKHIMEHYE